MAKGTNDSPHAVVTTNSSASKGTVGYTSSEKKGRGEKKHEARHLEGLVQGVTERKSYRAKESGGLSRLESTRFA